LGRESLFPIKIRLEVDSTGRKGELNYRQTAISGGNDNPFLRCAPSAAIFPGEHFSV
jgi:hypothetical protein